MLLALLFWQLLDQLQQNQKNQQQYTIDYSADLAEQISLNMALSAKIALNLLPMVEPPHDSEQQQTLMRTLQRSLPELRSIALLAPSGALISDSASDSQDSAWLEALVQRSHGQSYYLSNTDDGTLIYLLLHQPSGGSGGPASDIAIQAREIVKARERIARTIARETGKPLVVVLMSSKPQVMPACVIGTNGVIVDESTADGVSAFMWAPNPGMKGGQAIAEIILGETEPSGRLPITFPRHAGQLPVYYNQIRGQHGNRYADLTQDPAFAFGEGLGYTTFAYGEPTITNVPASGTFATTDTMHVEVALTNTGERKGTEVAQLYIGDIVTSYSWTDRELKAFQRVELEPGETKTVAFDIPVSECTIVDSDANRIVEPGEFEVLIGHSSRRRDLKRTTFTVA